MGQKITQRILKCGKCGRTPEAGEYLLEMYGKYICQECTEKGEEVENANVIARLLRDLDADDRSCAYDIVKSIDLVNITDETPINDFLYAVYLWSIDTRSAVGKAKAILDKIV